MYLCKKIADNENAVFKRIRRFFNRIQHNLFNKCKTKT